MPEKTLQEAVFDSIYTSRQQVRRRRIAMLVLLLVYMLRGLLILWPVYVLVVVGIVYPQTARYLTYLLAVAPGVLLWLAIYVAGARKDYIQRVQGHILKQGYLSDLLRTERRK